MIIALSSEDQHLDRLWRARFGQPLPVRGCADLVRALLLLSSEDDAERREAAAPVAALPAGLLTLGLAPASGSGQPDASA